jgi:PAP2 superfamily
MKLDTLERFSARPSARKVPAAPLLIGAGCVGAMVALGAFVRHRVPAVDGWTMKHMSADPSGALSIVATGASEGLRIATVLALASGITVLWRRQRRPRSAHLLKYVALFAIGFATSASKAIFQRPQPTAPEDWSFPSAHVGIVTSAVFAGVVLCHVFAPQWRRLALGVGSGAVVLTALTRMVLGEHYLTDIVGAVVGTVGVSLLAATALRILPHRRGRGPEPPG